MYRFEAQILANTGGLAQYGMTFPAMKRARGLVRATVSAPSQISTTVGNDAVRQAIMAGLTEDQAVATIQWPQYEKLRGYESQRPVAIRRLYRQLTGALP